MRTARRLLPALLVAALLGCQSVSGSGGIDELPSSDPTAVSTGLADGE
ncbi:MULTISPECIES: hypothetical protein [unclassified Massilia]|nr:MULTISPECIES: hypothetical protein [unclassified Massilia]MBD8531887.1 hypothetical protein [Massilia sp. CFBP 13647]MBD8675332.1 hypothetical protein [Massilia sp. CFBP 13721]